MSTNTSDASISDGAQLPDEFSLLHALIDAVPDPIFCKDRVGRYVLTNRAHAERLHIAPGACLGKTIDDMPQLADIAASLKADDQCVLETGQPVLNREEPFTWQDGTKGWYLTSKYPLKNSQGEVVGLVGIARNVSERRAAEHKLAHEHTMLRTVIDALADPIFFKDAYGRLLLVNDAHRALTGLGTEEVAGRTDLDVSKLGGYSEELARGYMEDDLEIFRSGQPVINREESFADPDGAPCWFLTSKFPLRSVDGQIVGLVGIARDITKMKRASAELIQAQSRLIDHVENSPLGVIEWGRNFHVQRWSGRAQEIFGWSAAEVMGKHFGDWTFVHPEDASAVAALTDRLRLGQEQRNISRNRNLTKDGRVVHCAWYNSVLRDAEGNIISMLSLVEDVTERFQAAAAIRDSQRFYETLVEATATGYVVLDALGCVIEANSEYIRLAGADNLEQIRGRSVLEWTALYDRARHEQEIELCLRTGAARNVEIDHTWPNGWVVPMELNARMIETSEGIRIIGLCRNISDRRASEAERKQMERKLVETQKLESLGVLAGGIAHDFNNLLTGILGNASLAALDVTPNSSVARCLEQIEIASTRAAELCQQMLAYSGKGRFVVRRLDLNSVIRETNDLLRVSISKNAVLILDLSSDLPVVKADPTQLRQIIMNLVINASEALRPEAGAIRISTGLISADSTTFTTAHLGPELVGGDYVYLEVVDNGCGMPPEVRDRIFDPFFTTKFTGRGLGLAAVLGIVRGHGGAVQVESTPGQGTVFRILLPAAEGAAEREEALPKSNDNWKGHGRILVIDDEETVRATAAQMLRAMGFEVSLAVDGNEGINIFRKKPAEYAAVLLDLTMPRLGGEEAWKVLREISPDVRVIMMSGYNENEVAARFGDGAPSGFIQKPFRLPALREKLRAALT